MYSGSRSSLTNLRRGRERASVLKALQARSGWTGSIWLGWMRLRRALGHQRLRRLELPYIGSEEAVRQKQRPRMRGHHRDLSAEHLVGRVALQVSAHLPRYKVSAIVGSFRFRVE